MKDYREYNCTTKKDVKQAFKDLKETATFLEYEDDLLYLIKELNDLQDETKEVINIIKMYLERKKIL